MITEHTVETLRRFETVVADEFNAGHIRAPVHLEHGNEECLIEAFATIKRRDWVFGSWRQHLKCLLKGVPEDELLRAIMNGHSMTLCFPEHRILSSAIVGGVLPIALGVAKSIKLRNGAERVHCFMGDMTSESGVAHESIKYADRHELPIRWIIEDNGISTYTPTKEVWRTDKLVYEGAAFPGWLHTKVRPNVAYYRYHLKYPHSGAGRRIQF